MNRNVKPSTTETSKQNRAENGTELLPDRLAEIRARLDAATQELVVNLLFGRDNETAAAEFITNAPDDIAFLLERVQLLEDSNSLYRTGATTHISLRDDDDE